MYQCVAYSRARGCEWGRGGAGCFSVRVRVCVYMVAILKVSRLAERERESQVCVYSHVARYKGVASS